MRILILISAIIPILAYPGFCQVDTLQLVEIGSIQAPAAITGLYVEDLDGDSLKEIIICTDSYVYIYNSQSYQVEWTSPPLNHPGDLLFEDINRDGLIDFSVKDNSNIYLFDTHTPQTIWVSPELDSTYKCYTIGDRNDDDWIDVAIVTKEPFTRLEDENNRDTVWTNYYDGPSFILGQISIITMSNYRIYRGYLSYDGRFEFPIALSIQRITGNDGDLLRSIIFTYSNFWAYWPLIHDDSTISGQIFFQDCFEETLFVELACGLSIHHEKLALNNMNALYNIGKYTWYHEGYPEHGGISIFLFSSDSTIFANQVWDSPFGLYYWRGFTLYDFMPSFMNDEYCYGSNDSIHCLSYDGTQILWEISGLIEPFRVLGAFRNDSTFNSPQIVCGIGSPITHYELYDGGDGSLSAVMPVFGGDISHISDLDNDGIDAVLSIQNSELKVYLDETATKIEGDDPGLPLRLHLSNFPNPFNSSTTIDYGLPEPGRVRIDIYDLLGRKVETLVDADMPAGRHQAVWDGANYSSGVYFYRIEAGDFVNTKKMVYLK